MVRVRFVTMQRNEGGRLRDWVEHHGALCAPADLLILDNGSTDPETLDLLRDAERRGVSVRRDFGGREHFDAKGRIVADAIRRWDVSGGYDLAVPCDADERLAVWTDEGVSTEPAAILAELAEHVGSPQALRIDTSLFNDPGMPGWYAPDTSFCKSFLAAGTIAALDGGFHAARSRVQPGHRQTQLVWLHEHNGSFAETRLRARTKLRGRVDPDDPVALRAHARAAAAGAHLVPILLMDEQAFLDRYQDRLRIHASPRARILRPNELLARDWSGAGYLYAHPDVALRWELSALQHYVRHGFDEGRLPGSLIPAPTRALRAAPGFAVPIPTVPVPDARVLAA